MRHLLNTLCVTSEDAYLTLDGENIVVKREQTEVGRFPLHNLSGIVCFSYAGASPALMGACAKRNVALSFCTPRGRFLARTAVITSGYSASVTPAASIKPETSPMWDTSST